ncbi:STR6L-like protein [Mya arenaria]|uniref:STR6L-like protein n=1 Tax=Mya arenaria TaxID=6604 RepID=A0ABY7FT17_MYAAR|nr:STR6L-like protein [Mya arenaria]
MSLWSSPEPFPTQTPETTTPVDKDEYEYYCNETVFKNDIVSSYSHWFLIPSESVDVAGASIAMKLPVVLFSLFVVIKFVGKLTKCLRQKKYSRSRSEEIKTFFLYQYRKPTFYPNSELLVKAYTTINLVTVFDFISHKYGLLTVANVFACLTTIPCGLRNVYLVLMSYSYPACTILIFKIQMILVAKFFMQPKLEERDKYKPLAVNNRTVYDVFSFFMLFLNASIGLVQYLKRILFSAVLGVFLIPRMDRSLYMRGDAMERTRKRATATTEYQEYPPYADVRPEQQDKDVLIYFIP